MFSLDMRFFTRLVLRSEWHIFSRTIVSCHSDVPARNFITFLQILSFQIDMRNLMRNIRLTGDSSSLTVVRMTSLVISNVCERYYVSLLGRRIFGAIHLRMTYFLTRDSSRQISCYYRLAWDSSLHDRFVQNDSQMSFRDAMLRRISLETSLL